MEWNCLFGRPVQPTRPRADGPRELFVLGTYPSALHVRWESDRLPRPIRAVAVDNEPEPFWTGKDEQERIAQWQDAVSFREEWGRVSGCGDLNGSSGIWLEERVLTPLGINDRKRAWITDCLDIYCESKGAAALWKQPEFQKALFQLGIRPPHHHRHPGEAEIVQEASATHAERLRAELRTARPELIVTLGNAALRVLAALAESSTRQTGLSRDPQMYGQMEQLQIAGRSIAWLPLAHPAAPGVYQQAHAVWLRSRPPRY